MVMVKQTRTIERIEEIGNRWGILNEQIVLFEAVLEHDRVDFADRWDGLWAVGQSGDGLKADKVLLSDEIYRHFCYDGPFASPAKYSAPQRRAKSPAEKSASLLDVTRLKSPCFLAFQAWSSTLRNP